MKRLLAVFLLAPLLLAAGSRSNTAVRLTNKSGHTLEIEVLYGMKTVWQRTATASLKEGQSRQWPFMDRDASIYYIRAADAAEPQFKCHLSGPGPVNYDIGEYARLRVCQFKYLNRAR